MHPIHRQSFRCITVYETLRELGATGKKIVTLLNKQDQVTGSGIRDLKADYTVKCSARTGEGLDEFKDVLAKLLAEDQIYLERVVPVSVKLVRSRRSVSSEPFSQKNIVKIGIFVKARVPAEIFVSVMPK